MQFANPIALLLLGLIPILILIHSLRPKPRQVEVTNLFLWQEALKERRGGGRIRKIIKNLSLLLQILAVILTTTALAEPVWFHLSEDMGNVILVLDSTASMKSRTASGVRFDQARKEALKIIDDLQKGSRMLIIEAGGKATLRSGLLDNRSELKKIAGSIQPTDSPGQVKKALYLALSFMDPEQNDRIFFVTDGAGSDLGEISRVDKRIKTVLITGGENNTGITKFEVRQGLDYKDRYEIMVEVKNYNQRPVICPIGLFLDEEMIIKNVVRLKASEKRLLIFPFSGPLRGTCQASLDLDDDFPTDNNAFTVLNRSREVWVLLVTKGNYFLQKLLEANPNLMVNSVEQVVPSAWEEQVERHDIVILDRVQPPSTEKGNFLLIDSFSPSIPISEIGTINMPEVLDWDRKNPLMANLDLSRLVIERAARVKSREGLQPIVESTQTGLIYTYKEEGLRAVLLGFDLTRSDLPLRAAFPIMMSNIFQWLLPDSLRFSRSQIKAGESFPIYLAHQTGRFSVLTPSEKWEKYQGTSSPFHYTDTREVGVYSVVEGERWSHFAVNLLDESESDIRASFVGLQSDGTSAETEPVAVEHALWILFLLSASIILILEWHLWLRDR